MLGRGNVRSDHIHVIALANASGARLLYTEDKGLMDDFKNKDLISKPRGTVYSRAKNAILLADDICR